MVRPKHDNPGDLSAVQTLQVTLFRLQYNLEELCYFIAVKHYPALTFETICCCRVGNDNFTISFQFVHHATEKKRTAKKDKAIFARNLHRVCLEIGFWPLARHFPGLELLMCGGRGLGLVVSV